MQREAHKKQREERLDTRNDAGYFDLTAFKAVANIREKVKPRDKSIHTRSLK